MWPSVTKSQNRLADLAEKPMLKAVSLKEAINRFTE